MASTWIRAIFVLREAFDVLYGEISECVGRSPAACRQVVRRARTMLRKAPQGPGRSGPPDDPDGGGVARPALHPVRGRDRVAAFLTSVIRLLRTVERMRVDGAPVVLLFSGPNGRCLYLPEHDGRTITGIQVHANPAKSGAITTAPDR